MNAEHVTIGITVVAMLAMTVLGGLFLLLSAAGRVMTDDDDRSALGNALGHVLGASGLLIVSFAGLLMLRLSVGPGAPLEPVWANNILRTTLAVSAVWCLIAALLVLPRLVVRLRKRPADVYEINQAAVFGALAQALPIIVSDDECTIQHTTAEFDALVGGLPGDLIGKPLETIMPERYHAGHAHGMQRYIETREPRIIGTVVALDMLRRDGEEIPIYLALNTTEVEGKPWFVASIWVRSRVEPAVLVSTFSDDVAGTITETATDVAEMKVDVKTLRKHAESADVRADAADVRADAAEARADAAETDRNGT